MRWSVCQRESAAAESAFDTKNAKMHLTAGRGNCQYPVSVCPVIGFSSDKSEWNRELSPPTALAVGGVFILGVLYV